MKSIFSILLLFNLTNGMRPGAYSIFSQNPQFTGAAYNPGAPYLPGVSGAGIYFQQNSQFVTPAIGQNNQLPGNQPSITQNNQPSSQDEKQITFEEFIQSFDEMIKNDDDRKNSENKSAKQYLNENPEIKKIFEQWYTETITPLPKSLNNISLINIGFNSAIDLYNFKGAPETPIAGIHVYRLTILHTIITGGENINYRDTTVLNRILLEAANRGLKSNFWKNASIPFYYKTLLGRTKPVIVCNNENQLLIAFYGTAGFRDLLADARVPSRPMCQGGQGHTGFIRAAESCKEKLLELITKFIGARNVRDIQIILTGHSLGGAVALISAFFVLEYFAKLQGIPFDENINIHNNVVVLTIGQPRVLRAGKIKLHEYKMAPWYETIIRTANLLRLNSSKIGKNDSADVISHMPLESWDFQHIGYERLVKMNQLNQSNESDYFTILAISITKHNK